MLNNNNKTSSSSSNSSSLQHHYQRYGRDVGQQPKQYNSTSEEIEDLKAPLSTKPVTLQEVENSILLQGLFDQWCDRLFDQFETSDLCESLQKEVSTLLEGVLSNSKDIPPTSELILKIDGHDDIKRKMKCWIHRNLYPHFRTKSEYKHNVNPDIATEIEKQIENTVQELQSEAFENTEKSIRSLTTREHREKIASKYKNLTEDLTNFKPSENQLDDEKREVLYQAKLKRRQTYKDYSNWDATQGGEEEDLNTSSISVEQSNVDEIFPMKKRKIASAVSSSQSLTTQPTVAASVGEVVSEPAVQTSVDEPQLVSEEGSSSATEVPPLDQKE